MNAQEIQRAIQKRYGDIATSASRSASCCGPSCCSATAVPPTPDTLSTEAGSDEHSSSDSTDAHLYQRDQIADLPEQAVHASLGCGNPTALIDLRAGQTVLDLGSGGGIDVLLSARRVGPSGKVYGLDMTDEMLELAKENQRKAGLENVEFLKGDIQEIPLPDNSVDVVISNCVINLAPDKDKVLREAYRVLKAGGRFAVSDIVTRGPVPSSLRRNMELWVGCIAGALEQSEYEEKLRSAGFTDVAVEIWRVYAAPEEARDGETGTNEGQFASAFIRATK